MYCPSCGKALSRQMKYCNFCGAQLPGAKEMEIANASEKRLDEYLDGLFWITVFGLGLILGGMVLIKEVLQLSRGFLIGYLVLSTLAFLVNFGLSLWQVFRMTRESKAARLAYSELDTNKLPPAAHAGALEAAPSVTEDPTRAFEPAANEPVPR